MYIELDTHAHTIACSHAYSTIREIAHEASQKQIKLICITEHGPMLKGGAAAHFFSNISVVPEEIEGVKVLKGIEANILNSSGEIDLPPRLENRLDIVLAGLHEGAYTPGSKKENTSAIINTMKKEVVDIIVHLGNPRFDLDYDDVVKAAADTNTFIEINNSSFVTSRYGSKENCKLIARKCKELNLPVTLGSDAHYATYVAEFTYAIKMLEEMNFPEDLVVNTSVQKLLHYLRGKGKKVLETLV